MCSLICEQSAHVGCVFFLAFSVSAELVTELELLSERLDIDISFFLDPLGLFTCFNSESNQEASVKFRAFLSTGCDLKWNWHVP
jgi:hypothetical protein